MNRMCLKSHLSGKMGSQEVCFQGVTLLGVPKGGVNLHQGKKWVE